MGGRKVGMMVGSILLALTLTGLLLVIVAAEATDSDPSGRDPEDFLARKPEMSVGTLATDVKVAARTSLSPSLLVDDFHDEDPTNELGGESGWASSHPTASITCSYPDGMLCCHYDVSPTPTYALYWTDLLSRSLAGYNSLSFRVKGNIEGETADAELKDCDDPPHYSKLRIEDYTAKPITASWQQVAMPLVGFTEVADWKCLEKFGIVITNAGGDGTGTICLDDVWFEPTWVPVLVDGFNDCQEPNALKGATSRFVTGTATMGYGYTDTIRRGDIGCAQWITYAGVTGISYAVWQTELKGLDASEYEALEFYIKGSQGEEKPNVWLESLGVRTAYTEITVIATGDDWQRVVIPVKHFSTRGVSLANLMAFQLGFEWKDMAGAVYLDDIQFIPHTIYLPLITKNYHRLCNGDFETCDFTCWTHGGELNQSVRSTMPHTGQCAALLGDPGYDSQGGVPVGSAWMCQPVSVPSTDSPRLSFWYRIYSYDVLTGTDGTTIWDSFDVYINDTLILRDGGKPPQGVLKDTGWKPKTYDLTANRGETIDLCFHNWNRTDGYQNTWTYVDDATITE